MSFNPIKVRPNKYMAKEIERKSSLNVAEQKQIPASVEYRLKD